MRLPLHALVCIIAASNHCYARAPSNHNPTATGRVTSSSTSTAFRSRPSSNIGRHQYAAQDVTAKDGRSSRRLQHLSTPRTSTAAATTTTSMTTELRGGSLPNSRSPYTSTTVSSSSGGSTSSGTSDDSGNPQDYSDDGGDYHSSDPLHDDESNDSSYFSEMTSVEENDSYEGEYGENTEKGALYDAYNLLHTLAQDFQKPFDAPAVVVVGHQSSGKSALIEALMGFQFNQVGGGTKTRRPIALRMQYNPQCAQPKCFLQCEDGIERPQTLSEIQEYIESENARLEKDPVRSFDSREINVRMEYKYCPNMILIDTPGLISAPRIPKGRGGAGAANMQQRALLKSAREAERMVVNKMKCQDYIILCVEDTMDWKHGQTREVVQKADPDLSRTVIVNTKFDTKVPQFGTPSDVCDFLRAPVIDGISPHKLGGPFFTSVPSGRVGRPEDPTVAGSANGGAEERYDYDFEDDDEFVAACLENEESDRAIVAHKLKKMIIGKEHPISATKALNPRIGLSRLRGFLERRVDECYRRNVAKIVPILQAEHAACERRLDSCERELEALSVERLKEGADAFCDEFCAALKDAIQGSVIAPPNVFGETLEQENSIAGSFHDIQGCPMAVADRTWDRLLVSDVGNQNHRLYGGAQYHRAMREFHLATRCLRLPTITEDEIANAAGMGDTHDGVNFLRASCVIALEKARTTFDPLLESLRIRLTHVMTRICPVSEYMLVQKKERDSGSYGYGRRNRFRGDDETSTSKSITDIAQNPQFRQLIRTVYERFVQKCSDSTMMRCQDDLTALTKFVTWDLHERSSGALRRSLPDQTDIVAVYQVAVKAAEKGKSKKDNTNTNTSDEASRTVSKTAQSPLSPIPEEKDGDVQRDYTNLLQLMEEAACSRDANRTNMVVGGLVQHIVAQWRETFSRSAITKFNCYFLLPFVDDFNKYLRQELQKVYEGENICDVFDLTAARRSLRQQRDDLINECAANKKLQEKFDMVSKMMREQEEKEKSSMSSTKRSSRDSNNS